MKKSTLDKYKMVLSAWAANNFNGSAAYKQFYPDSSDRTAEVEFSKILRIPELQAHIEELKKQARKTLRTSHDDLLRELESWAYSDITEFIDLSLEDVKALPEDIRRLVTSFERKTRSLVDGTEVVTVRLTFVSKEKAMEMIHKHTGFYGEHNFQKNVELSAAERQEILAKIEERRKRLEQRKIDELL